MEKVQSTELLISKRMIKVLSSITSGLNTREKIAKNLGLSKTWISEIVTKLEKSKFIYKKRKGNAVYLELADISFAQDFKNMIENSPNIKFEDFLYGLNFRILSFCLFDWKTSKIIAAQLNLNKKTIWNRLSVLTSRGLLKKNKEFYMTNEKAWPVLYSFLEKYRMFYNGKGNILWKFKNEEVFCVTKKEEIEGRLTGFSQYSKFKVPISTAKYCCYLPEKRITKEEIFIHSILQITDSREVMLSLVFYLKNNLNKNSLYRLSLKYDCRIKLEDLNKILKQKKTEIFPLIKEKELREFFEQYGVKWKIN